MSNMYSTFDPAPTMTLSVMSDPRICRGSVAARRREEASRRVVEEKRRREDYRFRTEMIRNRLKLMTGGPSETQSRQRQIIGLRNVDFPSVANEVKDDEKSTVERRHTMARLAGPLRRRYQPSFGGIPRRDDTSKPLGSVPISRQTAQNRTAFLQLPLTNSANAVPNVVKAPAGQRRVDEPPNGFKNVRFLPFHEPDAYQQSGVAKVMPLLPDEKKISPSPLLPNTASTATTMGSLLASGYASTGTRKSSRHPSKAPVALRRHVIMWSNIDTPEDPPPTANGPPTFADSGMQTEEEKAFEDTFAPLITSMVSGAISDAMRSLLDEEDFGMIAKREKKLKEVIDKQNAKNTELNKVVEQQLELQKELEEQKEIALRQLRALESRSLAADALSGMDGKSVEELISRNMVQVECGQRSVAADTQQLERSIARTKRAAAEVRTDFFPYVYARAERIFVERLAGSYLKDALFARDGKRRDDAQALLNAQIFKYNQLIDASKKTRREASDC